MATGNAKPGVRGHSHRVSGVKPKNKAKAKAKAKPKAADEE
jgi:hypothetical protein